MKLTMLVLVLASLFNSTLVSANDNDSVPIHGFFDIDARYIGKEENSKFSTGYLDFYITKNLSNRLNVLMDIVFETIDDSYAVDIERLNITYDANEYLKITAGKFHTPYGYWNTAFHHGLQIQTSILRPKFLAFEDRGGILPSHGVGINLNGDIGNFSYNAYTTSGVVIKQVEGTTSTGIISTQNGNRQDGNKMLGLTLAYNIDDTKIGIHSFIQRVNIFNSRISDIFMGGAFLAMELENFELYSELYYFQNTNQTGANKGQTFDTLAFFVQAAYAFGDFKPYIRFETASYNQSDYYFYGQSGTAGLPYDRGALGIAYNISDDATIKVAYVTNQDSAAGTSFDLLTQFAVRF